MKLFGTVAETDWAIEALAVAGCCEGCPARRHCVETDKQEEAAGIDPNERTSCGEMLRDVIKVENRKPKKRRRRNGRKQSAARKSTV